MTAPIELPETVGSSGQSTAELAILLPALLILVLVVVQVGVVAGDYVVINHAAGRAARRAAVAPSVEEARAAAVRASPALEPDRLTVTLAGERSSGELLTVEVRYRSPTAVPIVGSLIDDVDITVSAVARIE